MEKLFQNSRNGENKMKIKSKDEIIYTSIEEVKTHLNNLHKNWNWLDYLESYWHRYFWNYVSVMPLNVKSFIQRGNNGWANSDTWDFDYYLSKIIAEGIQHLIEINHTDDDKRLNDLKEIVKAMQLAIKINEENIYCSKEAWNKAKKEFNKGMKLLTKRWFELWD